MLGPKLSSRLLCYLLPKGFVTTIYGASVPLALTTHVPNNFYSRNVRFVRDKKIGSLRADNGAGWKIWIDDYDFG
jgi:hypothetical protein